MVEKSYLELILGPNGQKIDEKEIFYRVIEVEITDNLSEEKKKPISSIKQGKNGIEVTTYDRVKALELLGRHLGMFKDKVEVSGDTEITIKIGGEDYES